MASLYGNEWKDRLKEYLSPEQQEMTSYVISEMQLIILNASLWHCRQPWAVPERKVTDNLILILEKGTLDVQVADQRQTIIPGNCVFIPENLNHSYGFHEGCSECSLFVMHALPLHPSIEHPFSGLDSFFQNLEYSAATFSMLRRGIALRNYNQNEAFAYVSWVVQSIILDLVSAGHYRKETKNYTSSRIKEAYRFIHNNVAEDFSIRDVAESVGLKEVQFRKLFRRETGFSPNAYIHRLRLLYSVRLLTRYNYSLKEVAGKSGFNSVSYFCSSFMKYFHCTPEHYRKKQQK